MKLLLKKQNSNYTDYFDENNLGIFLNTVAAHLKAAAVNNSFQKGLSK